MILAYWLRQHFYGNGLTRLLKADMMQKMDWLLSWVLRPDPQRLVVEFDETER